MSDTSLSASIAANPAGAYRPPQSSDRLLLAVVITTIIGLTTVTIWRDRKHSMAPPTVTPVALAAPEALNRKHPAKPTIWLEGARWDILKTIIVGIVTAIGGYLAAAIWSPQQFYHWRNLAETDSYEGVWHGTFNNREATLTINREIRKEAGGTAQLVGEVLIRSSGEKIDVHGSGDSLLNLLADLPGGKVLTISLQRVRNDERSADEHMVRLVPINGSAPVTICPKAPDVLNMTNGQDCSKLTGFTYFLK